MPKGKTNKGINSNSKLWKGCGELSGCEFAYMRCNAKVRKLDFNITINDVWAQYQKQEGKCSYSGLELKWNVGNSSRHTSYILGNASLDRIDSTKSYSIDNIQIVHKDINKMKWDLDEDKFLNYVKLVSEPITECVSLDTIETKKRGRFNGCGNIYKSYLYGIKQKANKRNIICNLSCEDMWIRFLEQDGCCYFTGLPLLLPRFSHTWIPGIASLDRIDTNKPYDNNIRWVHKDLNDMRWEFEDIYFRKICKLIYEYRKLKIT